MRYLKIATAQARPLQYKNCYNWELVAVLDDNTVYYTTQSMIIKSTLSEVISLHNLVTKQKPVSVKQVKENELWGASIAIIRYAIGNNLETQHYNFMDDTWQEVLKNAPKFTDVNHNS